jgi:hypothetical protein
MIYGRSSEQQNNQMGTRTSLEIRLPSGSWSRAYLWEEVSKLLGHTSIKTTEKFYAQWVKARQDRLDALVVGTWTTKVVDGAMNTR